MKYNAAHTTTFSPADVLSRVRALASAWKTTLLACLFGGVSFAAPTLLAQQLPTAPEESLPAQRKWVDFEVVLGRLTVMNPRHVSSQCAACGDEQSPCRELFSVTVNGIYASVHYEWADESQQVVVDFARGDDVTIERKPQNKHHGPPMLFRQKAGQDLTLTVGVGSSQRVILAESLWHLLLAEPEASQKHLLPILKRLRPNWRLSDQAKQLETGLVSMAEGDLFERRRRWRRWVDQLRSREFHKRQEADLQLRSAGHAVLSFLATLDPSQLDAEQRLRIRRIQQALTIREGDTPQRIAVWYVVDKPIWMALLTNGDVQTRRAAAEHLSRICGRTIDFSPLADKTQRQTQLEKLRTTLAGE